MNQINFVAIIGAVFAGIISVVQVFHGSAIGDLEDGTMHKDTIQTSMMDLKTWQSEQDRRIDTLESKQNLRIHLEDGQLDTLEAR